MHLNRSDQGTFTPVSAQGGPWNSLRKPLSHRNFAMKIAPYMYGHFDFGQNLIKTTFPKEFFKVEEHK